MPNLYEYQSLPGEDCIRILLLSPGTGDEPLSGDLRLIHLSQPEQDLSSPQREHDRFKKSSDSGVIRWTADIPYEAISYVWGSYAKDHCILLSGKAHEITANLSDALHQCRLPDQSRALWADSICINQQDGTEKNHQVYIMGRIYASSQRTLICLGTDPKNRHHAQDASALISDVNHMVQGVFQSPGFSWGWNKFPWPPANDPLVHDSRWRSFDRLCRTSWFRRGWIVQEAALGCEARVLWSGCTLVFLDLIRTNDWYTRRARYRMDGHYPKHTTRIPRLLKQIFFHERYAESMTFNRTNTPIQDLSLLSALEHAGSLGVSDARDRIYAFMALPFVRNPVPDLRPNYEQSHLELYQDFAAKYLEETLDLDILSYVVPVEANGFPADTNLGSSWAPRWDMTHELLGREYRFAKHGLKFGQTSAQPENFVVLHGDNSAPALLQVQAIIFDSIELVSRSLHRSMKFEDLAMVWSQFAKRYGSISRQNSSSPGYDSNSLLFLKALTAGYFTLSEAAEDRAAAFKSYARFVQANSMESRDDLSFSTGMKSCHGWLMELSHSSHIFTLKRGHFGLGPRGTKQGDICAFVFGVSQPLILRKVPNELVCHYNIIAPAYVVSTVLDEEGLPRGLNQISSWGNWDKLREKEGWVDWGLREERIIIQ